MNIELSQKKIHSSVALLLVCSGAALGCSSSGGGGGGGGTDPPPSKYPDVVFCDFKAVPCLTFNTDINGNPTSCAAIGPDPVDAGSNRRVCYDHTMQMPAQACQAVCSPIYNQGHIWLDHMAFPDSERGRCTGTVGSMGDEDGMCAVQASPLTTSTMSSAGTNEVKLGGVATILDDGFTTDVALKTGTFNLAAPKTSCIASDPSCVTQINKVYLNFDAFSINGQAIEGLTLSASDFIKTPSGVLDPKTNRFAFKIPKGQIFDAVAKVGGVLTKLGVKSDQEVSGSLDVATGKLAFQFSVTVNYFGTVVGVSGAIATTQIVERAPVLKTPVPISLDLTDSCSANVTLAGSATSPLKLPLTLDYVLDKTYVGRGASVPATVGIGTHNATIVATDSKGGMARAVQQITVNDKTVPAFTNPPSWQTARSCSNAATAVRVTVPAAKNICTGAAATVTGTVVKFNGATTSIPVVNRKVTVPPGSGILRFTATNAGGGVTTVDQTLIVEAPASLYGKKKVTLADGGAVVNGTIYDGASGLVSIGNDAVVGSIFSFSPVQLRDRAAVTLIDTPATITKGNDDTIGAIFTTKPVLPAFPTLSPEFDGGAAVTVLSGQQKSIAPGQFGAVSVLSGGKLVLQAGTYNFTSLSLEAQAALVLPSTSQTVKIFVRDTLIYRGSTTTAGGINAPLYLGYVGSPAAVLDSPFFGTLIAPNAQVTLQTVNGTPHRGEFFALELVVAAHANVASNPFTCQ